MEEGGRTQDAMIGTEPQRLADGGDLAGQLAMGARHLFGKPGGTRREQGDRRPVQGRVCP